MRTLIVSAFPGTGKSTYAKVHPEALDLDSSHFSWKYTSEYTREDPGLRITGKTKNPDFPENYIKAIQENIGKYKYIFVSCHKSVREYLLDHCFYFLLIYPNSTLKETYIKRYQDRGNNERFIRKMSESWKDFLLECDLTGYPGSQCRHRILHGENDFINDKFLEDQDKHE